MRRNSQIILFAAICMLLMALSALPVTVHAEGAGCSAKSAVVIDSGTGVVLYEKNCRERLPMASTTKIMSALLALESGGLDSEFIVDSEAIKVEGSSMGLQEGDTVTMRALVCGMLLPSGNDAANAAAVRIAGSTEAFVRMMNERAEALGLNDTHFVTPSGLDDDTDDHYSTALDMARLAAECMKNEDFTAICSQKSVKVRFGSPPYDRTLKNTNKLLGTLDGAVGIKTGFTDKAGRCLISACERNGARLICVTLNDRDDWRDHAALYDEAFEKMHSRRMPGSGKEYSVRTAGGEKSRITAVAAPLDMVLPDSVSEKLTVKVCIKRFIPAPIESREEVGEIRWYSDGRLIAKQPIIAAEPNPAQKPPKNEWQKLLRRINDDLGSAA